MIANNHTDRRGLLSLDALVVIREHLHIKDVSFLMDLERIRQSDVIERPVLWLSLACPSEKLFSPQYVQRDPYIQR